MKEKESNALKKEIDEKSSEEVIKQKIAKKWNFLEVILMAMAFLLFVICIAIFVLYLIIDQIPSLYENDQIAKPLLDNRKYEIIRLLNGMNVMLISDPSLSFSSVGLSVNSGFSHDLTYGLYGIGNLVNEVLFNNKQKENLNDILSQYYGSSINNEVNLLDTSFSFEIGNEGFQKTIELFTDMIKFTYQNMTNEVIDSIKAGVRKLNNFYNSAHLNKEIPTLNILYKALGYSMAYLPSGISTSFVNSTFTICDLKKIVIKYYKENYVGSNMNLVVLAKYSLKEIKGIVIKLFSTIPMSLPSTPLKHFTSSGVSSFPTSHNKNGKIILLRVKNILTIFKFMFIFDNISYNTNYLYFEYLKYVFNARLEGSLYHRLLKGGMISAFYLSYDFIKEKTIKFEFNFELTQTGLDNIDKFIYQTANFISIIRNQRVNETIFEDMKKIHRINFKFREFDSSDRLHIANLAKHMEIFKEHLPDLTMTNYYTPEINHSYLNAILDLMKMDNCILFINQNKFINAKVMSKLAKMTGIEYPFEFNKDEVYSIPFAQAFFSKDEIDKMNQMNIYDKYFRIRQINAYVTTLNSLVSPESKEEQKVLKPNVIYEKNHIQILHKVSIITWLIHYY